jgi:hypothetical protein
MTLLKQHEDRMYSVSHGMAWLGGARQGMARRGKAWQGLARQGKGVTGGRQLPRGSGSWQ